MKQLPKPPTYLSPEVVSQPSATTPVNPNPSHHKFSIKPILWVSAGIGVIALIINAFKPVPIVVQTATIDRGPLQVTVNAEGKTRIQQRFIISAPVSGRLQRVQLKEGDRVTAGSLIAQIEPLSIDTNIQQTLSQLQEWQAQREGVNTQRPKTEAIQQAQARIQTAEANQKQTQAQVAQVQATLAQANRDRDRAEQLAASGAISRNDLETKILAQITRQKELESARMADQATTAEIEVARAALSVLQQEQTDPDYLLKVYDAKIASTAAELSRLRDDARRTDVTAPSPGTVLKVHRESAQFIPEGTPIVELGNTSQLEIVIDVLSSDAEKIAPGDAILINQGTATIAAKVQKVEPAAFTKVSALGVEEQRVNVIGRFSTAPKNLGDAYRLDTKIVIWETPDALKVPLSALYRCGQNWCVFTTENSKAKQQQITLGQRNQFEAEIKQGINQGETVILHPSDQIRDGVEISSRK
jgi:HlyD family secretion protein